MQRIPFVCPVAPSELATLWIAAIPARRVPFLENIGFVREPWIPAVPACTVQLELNESPEGLWGSSCVESLLMLEYLQVTEPVWRPDRQPLPCSPASRWRESTRKEHEWSLFITFPNTAAPPVSLGLVWSFFWSTMCSTPASSLEEGGLDWTLLRVSFGLVLP